MQKSLDFYKALLQKEPLYANEDRWITFSCGNTFSLYNKHYDEKIISRKPNEHFNQAYIDDFFMDKGQAKNNIVIFNFEVEDLKLEHDRLIRLNIGKVLFSIPFTSNIIPVIPIPTHNIKVYIAVTGILRFARFLSSSLRYISSIIL